MNTEKFGGVFLLQETQPKRLLGSMRSTTSIMGPGWIYGSFFKEPESINFEDVGNKTELVMSRDVALSLIGLFPVLLATNSYIRSPHAQWTCDFVESGRIRVHQRDGIKKRSLVASWIPDPEGISYQAVGDQIEWRIREDFAMELFFALVRRLAQTAANID